LSELSEKKETLFLDSGDYSLIKTHLQTSRGPKPGFELFELGEKKTQISKPTFIKYFSLQLKKMQTQTLSLCWKAPNLICSLNMIVQ